MSRHTSTFWIVYLTFLAGGACSNMAQRFNWPNLAGFVFVALCAALAIKADATQRRKTRARLELLEKSRKLQGEMIEILKNIKGYK